MKISEYSIDIGRYPPSLARHQGLFSGDDVDRLRNATVAVAGVGGAGGRVAELLARSGVGKLRLADPDVYSESNLNRQAACTTETLGQNKAVVVGRLCEAVSPFVEVTAIAEGVTRQNAPDFVKGADVVVDGTDYTLPGLGLVIASACSSAGTPVVMGVEIGYGAWHTVMTEPADFLRLLGLKASTTVDDLHSGSCEVPLWRWIATVPRYADLRALASISTGEIEAPAIAPAVELNAALVGTSVLRLLLGYRPLVRAPRVHHVDCVTGEATRFTPTRTKFALSVARCALARDRRTTSATSVRIREQEENVVG